MNSIPFQYLHTLNRLFRYQRQIYIIFRIVALTLIIGVIACDSTNQGKKVENTIQLNSKAKLDTPTAILNSLSSSMPTEYFVIKRGLQETHEDIINLYNSDFFRILHSKYKIGRDIPIKNGDLEWILISINYDRTDIRLHFISSTGSDNVKSYCFYYIAIRHLFEDQSLVSAFNITYEDAKYGLRNFLVVISRTEKKYYNEVFEILCSEGEECSLNELSYCNNWPIAKTQAQFMEIFPHCMSELQHSDTSKITQPNSTYYIRQMQVNCKTFIYYVDTLNNSSVKNIFDGLSFDSDKYVLQSLDEFYTIGRDIKKDFHFDNLFFRKVNQTPQICFSRSYSEPTSGVDNILFIKSFDLPKKAAIKSVFGYNHKNNNDYTTNYIVVISQKKNGDHITSLFPESRTNRFSFMEREFLSDHNKIFKDIKNYEDFMKIFPNIMRGNHDSYRFYDR